MIKLFLLSLLTAGALPYWQDMQLTGVNTETRRSELIWYAQREDALTKGFRESENYLDLNGIWDFAYSDDARTLEAEGAQWVPIKVPGNWEVQGFGTAIYTNIHFDFMPDNPQPPLLPEKIPAGLYRRSFTVPASWEGREVYLNFAGCKGGALVSVNGQEAGYCEDSKSVNRFRITPLLKEGENELLVKVWRYHSGSYLEDQDFWRLSGFERDVYLSSESSDSGFDFRVVSTLDQDLSTGIFKLKMRSRGPVDVFYELLDKDGSAVADAAFSFAGDLVTVVDSIPSVRRWSAETPELYTLLLQVNGEYTRFHVGFRRLEIATVKDGDRDVKALLVNGQPVKFKGVNLHEHNPWTGHYVTRQNILEDLKLMRQANINAIRTCHYPQSREFYELCDSLGFYVYDEANVETHGMGYDLTRTLGNNPDWYAKHIDRILNMYYRTANYPCVTILSLGNEAGNGVNFYEAYKELKALEQDGQNRPVCYERAEYEWNTDMIVPQYPGADWFRRMGETYSERPVCPSEYAHAMGNSTVSLDWHCDDIYSHPHLQGAYIWDWVDQGLWDPAKGWTYGGDYGTDMPSDGNFCCNGLVNPDREPHPGFWEVKHVYQNVHIEADDAENGLFRVFNRNYFVSLDGLVLRWKVERDGRCIRKGKHKLSAPAQSWEELKVKLPRMKRNGEYRILFETVTSKASDLLAKGNVVAMDQILLKDTRAPKVREVSGKVEVAKGDTRIVLKSRKAQLVFDSREGIVRSWTVKGKELIDSEFGLRPNYWRAPNDNDYGDGQPRRTQPWKKGPEKVDVNVEETPSHAIVHVVYTLPFGAVQNTDYIFRADGSLTLRNSFKGGPATLETDIPRLGFRTRLPKAEKLRYLGRGPMENYIDRCSAAARSLWTGTVSEQYFPYVRPQETGHHCETSWLGLGGISVIGNEPFEFSALHQRVEDLDAEEATARPYQWNNFSPDEDHSPDAGLNSRRRQTHILDVPVREETELCIDHSMTGIGGYDSWGARPERERTLWSSRDYSWTFTLVPSERFNIKYIYN